MGLSQQFHIKKNHAHTIMHPVIRQTTHTLSLSELSKKEACLQIKELAFPAP